MTDIGTSTVLPAVTLSAEAMDIPVPVDTTPAAASAREVAAMRRLSDDDLTMCTSFREVALEVTDPRSGVPSVLPLN
jgi:hypothetical protein